MPYILNNAFHPACYYYGVNRIRITIETSIRQKCEISSSLDSPLISCSLSLQYTRMLASLLYSFPRAYIYRKVQ